MWKELKPRQIEWVYFDIVGGKVDARFKWNVKKQREQSKKQFW